MSHGELHRSVAAEGGRIETAHARAHAEVFERGGLPDPEARLDTAWISADGTMVHDRASGTSMEVKIGLVFSGAERVGRDRWTLLDRQLYGGTEGWHWFAERFVALCARAGVFEAGRRCFVSYGADSIRWLREHYFPDAIELLDWYHLCEQLRYGVGSGHRDVLSVALGAASGGDVDALLAILHAHHRSLAARDPEQAARTAAVSGYVANNRQAIANYRIVPLASSGPMEKAVDLVVARRFKLRGMSSLRRSSRTRSRWVTPRDLGALLGRAVPCRASSLARAGLTEHRRLDASTQVGGQAAQAFCPPLLPMASPGKSMSGERHPRSVRDPPYEAIRRGLILSRGDGPRFLPRSNAVPRAFGLDEEDFAIAPGDDVRSARRPRLAEALSCPLVHTQEPRAHVRRQFIGRCDASTKTGGCTAKRFHPVGIPALSPEALHKFNFGKAQVAALVSDNVALLAVGL